MCQMFLKSKYTKYNDRRLIYKRERVASTVYIGPGETMGHNGMHCHNYAIHFEALLFLR